MEKSISLYQIADSFKKLNDLAEDMEGLEPYLDSVEMQLENKIDNIVKFRQELTATALAIDSEVQRLLAMKKSRERLAERLKDYVGASMLAHGIEKVDTGLFKLSFLKSESVEVDLATLDKEYIIEKITTNPDKIAIKKAIKDGIEVQGAVLTSKMNLQIK